MATKKNVRAEAQAKRKQAEANKKKDKAKRQAGITKELKGKKKKGNSSNIPNRGVL